MNVNGRYMGTTAIVSTFLCIENFALKVFGKTAGGE